MYAFISKCGYKLGQLTNSKMFQILDSYCLPIKTADPETDYRRKTVTTRHFTKSISKRVMHAIAAFKSGRGGSNRLSISLSALFSKPPNSGDTVHYDIVQWY